MKIKPRVVYKTIEDVRAWYKGEYPDIENMAMLCWCCGEILPEGGFGLSLLPDPEGKYILLCRSCLHAIHSATSPLAVLIGTGINTKEK